MGTAKNTETWKAVKVYWDGGKIYNGSDVCGMVIRAVDPAVVAVVVWR